MVLVGKELSLPAASDSCVWRSSAGITMLESSHNTEVNVGDFHLTLCTFGHADHHSNWRLCLDLCLIRPFSR